MKYLIDLLQSSLILYLSFLWNYKPNNRFKIGYPLFIAAFSVLLAYINFDRSAATVIAFSTNFILPIVLSKLKISKSSYLCLTNIGLISYLNSLFDMCFGIFYEKQFESILSYIIINIFIAVTVLIINKITVKSAYIRGFISSSKMLQVIILSSIWLFFVLNTSATILIEVNMKIGYSFAILNLLLMCIAIVVFVYLTTNYKKKELDNITIATLESNMKQQISYYEDKYKMYENLRRFKHDSDNIKIGLMNLLNQNDLEGAKAYLFKMSKLTNHTSTKFNTGSPVLDALLSDKQLEAHKSNTTITFKGILPYDALDIIDLCVLFGNAIDNAIEACSLIAIPTNKEINISVFQKKNLLMIIIENPVANKIVIKNNNIRSMKNDSINHGLGLYSIKNTVKKYNGYCDLKCSNNLFTLDMGLYIPYREKEAI